MSLKFNYRTNTNEDHPSLNNDSLLKQLDQFKSIINNPKYGFFHLTDNQNLIEQTKDIAKQFQTKKHFVQIGIGGSALGPQMLVSALRTNWDRSFTVLDNTDSDYLYDELQKINIKDAVFYVVSKSGGTAETIGCYAIIRNLLAKEGVAPEDFKNYFVFCTDPDSGQLRKHVTDHNYLSLEVASNIGGRFSVLSPVGLFPAFMMGINIDDLFSGANSLKTVLLSTNTEENDLLKTAAHLAYLLFEETPKVDETVLMPYSSKLKDFSFWFVQLWGESLGKFSKDLGVNTGLTPIPAYGATDQHSQMQLFMEGPHNKCLFLLNVKNKQNNFDLASDLEFESAKKLKSYSLNQLIEAEFQGSLSALKENMRNVIGMEIDHLNATNMGKLILFFESLTALMGEYLKVDPFDQPGVELGKKYAFEYLNSLNK